jgi:putative component of membrane protein insertase Oxa1/YidC/SpoIIIJ protein YidD
VRKISIILIRTYQFIWHPIYKGANARGVVLVHCRLHPTCSEYAIEAFQKHSFLQALRLTWQRLHQCHQTTNENEQRSHLR